MGACLNRSGGPAPCCKAGTEIPGGGVECERALFFGAEPPRWRVVEGDLSLSVAGPRVRGNPWNAGVTSGSGVVEISGAQGPCWRWRVTPRAGSITSEGECPR
jgi:hypothetical protein